MSSNKTTVYKLDKYSWDNLFIKLTYAQIYLSNSNDDDSFTFLIITRIMRTFAGQLTDFVIKIRRNKTFIPVKSKTVFSMGPRTFLKEKVSTEKSEHHQTNKQKKTTKQMTTQKK